MAEKMNVGDSKKTFKSAGLMGPLSGPPCVVYSDGDKIIRTRPYHYDEDFDIDSLNPWKIEARGRTLRAPTRSLISPYFLTYKKRVYSNNRVRYPLKRVDWDPEGERHPENRGKSKYERISWDEAATIIAKELLRVNEKYGMSAVLMQADMHGEGKHVAPSHGCPNRLLGLMGHYTIQMRNMDSWEGYTWGSKHVWGCEPVGEMQPSGNLIPDISKNAELLLFWGCDAETTPVAFDGCMASRVCYWFTELGIKCVYVDPALNFAGCIHGDKWIPVKPNTDAALYLAIIYTWLTEGTYDKDYLATHAVGTEEFFDYVLGKVDGEAKTPEWATEKCGVPVWTIKALARDWARKITSVMIGNGGPGIRGPYSTEPARLQSICLAMQGLGKPGRHQAKMLEWHIHSKDFPMPHQGEATPDIGRRSDAVRAPMGDEFIESKKYINRSQPGTGNNIRDVGLTAVRETVAPAQQIPKCMMHDALTKGHIEWYGLHSFLEPADRQWRKFEYPRPGCSRVHMIWTDSPCMVTCWNDGFSFAQAVRDPSIEFMVAQHPWLENDCYLADIILPVTTKHELNDISEDSGSAIFTSVYREFPACPPVGESVSDFDCAALVAKKISEITGDETIYKAYTYNEMTDEETIEDLYKGCGVAHLDVNDDFHKKNIFAIPCAPDVQSRPVGLSQFVADPKEHPLSTPTGLLEFTSTAIKEHFPDDKERPPYPVWIEKGISHDESLTSERAKKYPLLLMSNHGHWRMHANLDDITWNREVETMKIRGKDGYQYEPAWMNPVTAAEHGIAHGDIVKVFNERGTVLCGAYVTERMSPGVVYVDHGSRFDPISIEDKIDRGGAINLISPHNNTSKNATGMAISGYLVQCEKVTDEEMDGWKAKYPDAFARTIDKACGVCLDGWMVK